MRHAKNQNRFTRSKRVARRLTAGIVLATLLAACSGGGNAITPAGGSKQVAAPASVQDEFKAICESKLPATDVKIEVKEANIVEDYSQGIKALTANPNHETRGSYILGDTEFSSRLAFSFGLNSMKEQNTGMACYRPTVHLTLEVPSHLVHIASEFPPGSCAFDHIKAHEYLHVKVNREAIWYAATTIQAEFQAQLGEGIIYSKDVESGKRLEAQLNEAMKTYWLPRLQEILDGAQSRHQFIDTPEEYARSTTACNGSIARAIVAMRASG